MSLHNSSNLPRILLHHAANFTLESLLEKLWSPKTFWMSYANDHGRRWKYIQKRHRIERLTLVFGSDVEMLACAATCGTSDANGEASKDGLTLGGEDSGEVAVADAEVTVANGDEVAGTGVVADFLYCTVEHGIDKGVVSGEVDAFVHRALACKWVGAVAEW